VTCSLCSDACTQKNILDQIIEGLLDDDTVEDLLQEMDLTLTKAVHKCQALEAAKKQRATLHSTPETVAALKKPQNWKPQPICQGCGAASHPGGQTQCPAYIQICLTCVLVLSLLPRYRSTVQTRGWLFSHTPYLKPLCSLTDLVMVYSSTLTPETHECTPMSSRPVLLWKVSTRPATHHPATPEHHLAGRCSLPIGEKDHCL